MSATSSKASTSAESYGGTLQPHRVSFRSLPTSESQIKPPHNSYHVPKPHLHRVRSLSIVLQDVEISASNRDLTDDDLQDLQQTARGCHDVLRELSELVERNWSLDENTTGSKNRARRAWKRLNWSPEIAHTLQGRISANVTLLNAFQARITRTAMTNLVRHIEDQEYQRMLDWLSPTDYGLEQSDLIARRHPNTGRWLLDSPEFQRWLETPNATMFCPGIPGAGKTILAASVVEYLSSMAEADDGIGIAYVYLNFRRQEDQKLTHLLASLVKQLAQQDAFAAVALKTLHKTHETSKTRPSMIELVKQLNSIVCSPSFRKIFIIVDALDECQSSENCRTKFVAELSRLGQGGKTNIFATSRPIPAIQNAFKQSSTITLEIRAHHEDVHAYVEGSFDQLPSCIRRSTTLQEEIKTTIARAADGMFLLARIYVSQLDDKLTIKAVKTALSFFEEQGKRSAIGEAAKLKVLSQAYDQSMDRIQKQKPGFRQLAEKALLWIVFARRPLMIMELMQAVGIDENESVFDDDNIPQLEDVISACAGLAIVDEESSIVRLVHYTTQEYFEQHQDRWFPDAEWSMASACIAYLFTWGHREWPTLKGHFLSESKVPAHRLYHYAASHWGDHLASAPTHYQLSSIVMEFLQSGKELDRCGQDMSWGFEMFNGDDDFALGGRNALHFSAHFGLVEAIKELLLKGDDPNAANIGDNGNRTPIFYAIRSGKDCAVIELVRGGAKVVHNAGGEYATPLAVATIYGQDRLVEFLVENGAKVDDDLFDVFLSLNNSPTTALGVAAELGHTKTVKVLLAHGADIEFENKAGEAAIFLAAGNGHVEVVQYLINSGADVDSRNCELTTPLMAACQGSHLEMVKLLLLNGANFEIADMRGETAMRLAANSGVEAIILALIDAGAGIDAREMWFGTPLQTPLLIACQAGHTHLAKLFLSRGAHVEAYRKFIHRYARHRDPKNSDLTPLLSAAERGHASVVAALLEYNADKEATNAEWQTPLMLAAAAGNYDVVKLLVEAGVDIHGADTAGQNAATMVWGAYKTTKMMLKLEQDEKDTARLAGRLAKQREILHMFAAQGAKLFSWEWEEGSEGSEENWDEWDGYGARILIETDLQVNML